MSRDRNDNALAVQNSGNNKRSQRPFDWLFNWGLDRPLVQQGGRWDLDVFNSTNVPAVNIHEDEKAIYVDCEMPGIPKDKIQVEHENNLLTITGENEMQKEEQDKDKVRNSFGVVLKQNILKF
jgi:HSP20 family molecular chaperone IbpA